MAQTGCHSEAVPVHQPFPHGTAESPPEPTSRPERFRALALAAGGSLVVGYGVVAALLGLVASTAPNARFSTLGVLLAAGPGWLAAHHVPLHLGGAQLGVLPLLPTLLVVLLVARAAARAAQRLDLDQPGQARLVVFSIAGTHAVAGAVIALLMGNGPVRATPAVAFFGCAAVSGLAATIGVARRCGLLAAALDRLDHATLRGLRAGLVAVFALVAAGAAVLAAGLALNWGDTRALFHQTGPSVGAGVGMWLLCVGYLPNAVIGALSFLLGSGVSIGGAVAGPLQYTGGPVPAIPLLAALPHRALPWLPALLLIPVLVGVAVGWLCRTTAPRWSTRVRAVGVAALEVAVTGLVLAALAGGRLGSGPFDPVTVPAGLLAVLAFCLVAVPGAVIAWFVGPPAAAVEDAPDTADSEDDSEAASQVEAAEADDDADWDVWNRADPEDDPESADQAEDPEFADDPEFAGDFAGDVADEFEDDPDFAEEFDAAGADDETGHCGEAGDYGDAAEFGEAGEFEEFAGVVPDEDGEGGAGGPEAVEAAAPDRDEPARPPR
jgi:hypothetical protein